MSHAVSQFLVSLFLYLCVVTTWVKRRRQQILLGLVLGLAMLVRPQNALFGVVALGISLAQSQYIICRRNANEICTEARDAEEGGKKGIKVSLVAVGVMGLVALLVQVPQILVYQRQYGGLSQIPYLLEAQTEGYHTSFHWGQPQLLNVLFSGFHGLFSWHPLLFLAIVGLVIATQKMPRLAWPLLAAFGLQVYLIASWWCWWQGASFGGRMFSSCSFIFAFGLAALWDRFKGKAGQGLAMSVTLFFLVWNALLVLQYESGMIPPEEHVSVMQIVKNQFLAVPFFLKHIFER
jgi:hypothetical protein